MWGTVINIFIYFVSLILSPPLGQYISKLVFICDTLVVWSLHIQNKNDLLVSCLVCPATHLSLNSNSSNQVTLSFHHAMSKSCSYCIWTTWTRALTQLIKLYLWEEALRGFSWWAEKNRENFKQQFYEISICLRSQEQNVNCNILLHTSKVLHAIKYFLINHLYSKLALNTFLFQTCNLFDDNNFK